MDLLSAGKMDGLRDVCMCVAQRKVFTKELGWLAELCSDTSYTISSGMHLVICSRRGKMDVFKI